MKKKVVIFSDLDGTLLDHHTYSFSEANEALSLIKKYNIPLILTTSKTRAEVLEIQKDMEIEWPFIVENGGAVFFYRDKTKDFETVILGEKRDKLIEIGKELKKIFPLKLFSELSDTELKKLMNLPEQRLPLSKKREFSEPFILLDKRYEDEILDFSRDKNFKILKGGRFYHLVGKNQDKGKAVKVVIERFKSVYEKVISVGIGDSKNDLDMLKVVDYPILVRRWNGELISHNLQNVIESEFVGPKGFNFEIKKILKSLID